VSDNVTVSNSSSSSNADFPVATDEVGGVHFQKFKLIDGTDGSTTATGTNSNPIRNQSKTVSSVTTEAVISVGSSSTSVLAANASRIDGWVKNISTETIYVSLSAAATTAKPSKLAAGESLRFGHVYDGAVAAIHADAGNTHSLEVVEL
jgi:hypothetical protein